MGKRENWKPYNLSRYRHWHLGVYQKITANDRNKETQRVMEIKLGTLDFCHWVSLLFCLSFCWQALPVFGKSFSRVTMNSH